MTMMTKIITDCLLVKGGLIAIAPVESIDERDVFKFQIVDGLLFYQNELLSLPVSDTIMDHLLQEDENQLFFYGGGDPLARRFLASLTVRRDTLVYASGILWAMQQAKGPESETKEKAALDSSDLTQEAPVSSRYAGLKLPPDLKKPRRQDEETAATAA